MKLLLTLLLIGCAAIGQTVDDSLLTSQFALVGAGTTLAIARTARYRADGVSNTSAALAVTGATLTIERLLNRRLSRKAKVWLTIGNVAATALMSVYAERDAAAVRGVVMNLPGGYAP